MTRRKDTRRRILDVTERLLMQQGYHAFSFRDIADELGVKPAAVHYHFPTKPDLVMEALERYGQRFDAWVTSVTPLSPAQRLIAYFDVGRDVVAMDRICALAMLNTQLMTVPADVRARAVEVQERILSFYVESLEDARADGDVRFAGSARDKAFEVACALVGAQQLARALGPEAFERVMRPLAASLDLPMSTLRATPPTRTAARAQA